MIADFVGPATSFDDLLLPFAAIAPDVAAHPTPSTLPLAARHGHLHAVEHAGGRLSEASGRNVPLRQALAIGARSFVVRATFPGASPSR